MKRHSSTCQRYEPSHGKTCSTWHGWQRYEELHQKMEIMCINTKNIGLLPWVVCISGISITSMVDRQRYHRHNCFDDGLSSMVGRQHVIAVFLLWYDTLGNIEL